ncbi:receptor-like protein EIX1 [Cryptomeria japonica]|uniref:receptor-like protein EIX1 n=1 Tax=Cryptomeria japonica TaxID=3369 RepID=UPI0027DA8670|nr:receptor-like protein EIX1 [Cryptomeria japonica]
MLQAHFSFSATCLKHERRYLLNLSSGRLSSWRGLNCCEWEGVACDYHTSHVIRLDLSNDWYLHRLSGKLHPSLFNLRHLQHLDLSWNDFKGICIPPLLSKLQKLSFPSLSDAGFGGEVPLELGNMSSLRHLDLKSDWRHMLRSSKFDVWVRNLRSLEFLDMSEVNLTMSSEHWGEALSGLANLSQIDMYWCKLSGNIPDLSNLTRLSHLELGSNSFPFELPTWFENVSSLVSLHLEGCDLIGSIPSNFMPRSKLSVLSIGNNNWKGKLSFFLNHSSSLVAMYLNSCNLGRVISPVITNFSKLETLYLRWNNLQGGIPSSLDSLSSLATLNLSYNQLTGQIPPFLCDVSALRELHLSHNQLSGTIPDCILKMSSLKVLSLSSNGLTGNISLQLFDNLSHLQELDLSENQFHNNISTSWVPQFAHLEQLVLGSCNIEGNFPPFLSQQFQLNVLDLSDNSIEGNLPSWLWDLPNLSFLNLSNNMLEGSLPRKISHTFMTVDLHGNGLYGSLPALGFFSYLLDLSDNEFTGSIPETNGKFLFLSLSGNKLTGEIPTFACTDSTEIADALEILNLSKNKLTGMIPRSIGSCSRLSVLNLAQNVLQREIPDELGNLKALRTLNLNHNSLQGRVPSSIANCIHLRVLDLRNNNFEVSLPIWIEKLVDLRILSLASNKFEGIIPSQLVKLQNLQILDLSGNNLSGNIPRDVSKLYAMVNQSQSNDVQQTYGSSYLLVEGFDHLLQYADDVTIWIKGRNLTCKKIISSAKFIDLSHNNLSGNIPLEVGLISLNISKNNLSGSIPKSFGTLVQLESLDLSQNRLSGKIPSELLSLTFLAVLNLSNNMLSGLIPQGKQFSTFGASSFLGNPNLYGPQLENCTRSLGLGNKEKIFFLNNTVADVVIDPWWAIGLGLSYGVGFATMIVVLCFNIKWRSICFALMDNLSYHLFEH